MLLRKCLDLGAKVKESMIQTSHNIYRYNTTSNTVGRDRNYLLKKINLVDNDIAISKPYISSATGENCVTVAKIENGGFDS